MRYSLMSVDPLPARRRQRLPGFDYSTPGFYFVTLCIQDRLPLLGSVQSDHVRLSPAGECVQHVWQKIPQNYPGVELDTLMIMPDHVHAILVLQEQTLSLSEVIHHVKSGTTAQYAYGVRQLAWPPYHGVLWQRGFHDRVIRGEKELAQTREYIVGNPQRWWLRHGGE